MTRNKQAGENESTGEREREREQDRMIKTTRGEKETGEIE